MLCGMTKTMLIQEAFVFRLYPSEEQASKLRQTLGSKRFVYNYFLAKRQKVYEETGKGMSYEDCTSELPALKAEMEWLKEPYSQVLQQGLKDLDKAFKHFFKKEAGYPRFKKKQNHQSVRYPQHFQVNLETEQTFIPKIGWVKTVFYRPLKGTMRNMTVSLNPSGQFHISIQCQYEQEVPAYEGKLLGVDLGLTNFLTTSEGDKPANPRYLQKAQKRLKRRQRELSRKQKGSKSRQRARRKLAKAHQKVVNQRKDFLHKLSHRLTTENQGIGLETLNIRGMMQNHRLAQSIGSVGWYEFVRQLEYKGKRYGCDIVFAPPFYPSSKMCSNCRFIYASLRLSEREWQCEECGAIHDRDINAAINLRNYLTAGTVGNYAGGEGEVPLFSTGQTLDEARSYRL
jgi:putative transposase